MWKWPRDHRLKGWKFRRQHPDGPYYIDFFCETARLAVELDSSGHWRPDKLERDRERELYLNRMGIRVLRYANARLRRDSQLIRDAIFKALSERTPADDLPNSE